MVPICPPVEILRDKLRSIIHLDPFGKSVGARYSLQRRHNIDPSDACTGLEGKAFAGVVFHDHEHSQTKIVKQLIGDEVHTPTLVPRQSCRSDLPLDTRNTPTRRFLPHYQAFLAIEPIDTLVIHRPSFTL